MKFKQYSTEIWTRIEKATQLAKEQFKKPIAAFDADGTLWDTDLGENFFQFLIDEKKVPLPKDPWTYYRDLKKQNNDPRKAYLWLAQILKSVPIVTVKSWAQEAVLKISPLPIFEDQKKLIEYFHSKGVSTYIVTASIKWAVEPGAVLMGIDPENVIGVETKVKNDLVTDEQFGCITYKQGKTEALLNKSNGIHPFFASGNTMGDFALLESAQIERLGVSAARPNEGLFETEEELRQNCESRGWLHHQFWDSSLANNPQYKRVAREST